MIHSQLNMADLRSKIAAQLEEPYGHTKNLLRKIKKYHGNIKNCYGNTRNCYSYGFTKNF